MTSEDGKNGSWDPAMRSLREDGPREERHVRLGVSHPSGNPDQHRTFEIRASYNARAGGWVADVGEQDRNEQRGAWTPVVPSDHWPRAFLTAAACLGDAVATIVALVDRDAAGRE